ncbi:hypothetical protein DV738_g1980, partial [Chaetothyriales sp. CBS 135597]
MILQAEAARAKEIASIFDSFRDYVPEHRTAIDHAADNLEALATILSELDRYLGTLDDVVPSRTLADDLELLQHSVAYTFGDLWTILGDMPDECIGIDYRNAWKTIVSHTESARKESLHMRIEAYVRFAAALCRMLRGQPERRGVRIEELRTDINSLRLAQLNTRRFISATEAVSDLSACHPLPHDRDKWPSEREYERILKIIFSGGLKMHYYLRSRDHSTKIACQWPGDRHGNQESCLSLCDLHVKRSGSALYLCRPVAGYSNNTVWAQFIFPTIEWLIVFHLTFLALRSQDRRQQPAFPDLFDRELKGETRCFAGVITDSGSHHALRLYQDRSTGVIRLEAAVLKGSMKNTPVWTAFITHQVTSPTWLERADHSKSVYLADLKRHIFSSKYTPHVAASGQHVLAFDLLSDAEDFESIIRELRVRVLREAHR